LWVGKSPELEQSTVQGKDSSLKIKEKRGVLSPQIVHQFWWPACGEGKWKRR